MTEIPPAAHAEALRYTVEDGLARLILNRPARLNAFNAELAHAWADATTDAVSRDDVGAILIGAAGPHFCAGGDVIAMATEMHDGSEITDLAKVINRGIRALTESSKPVVAAAQGTTAGGGLGILMCSDYAVVGENSRIGSLYANIGLTPDLSVSAQLARAVGERRALQLVLQDRLLTAAEAREWGLVAEVVAPDDVTTRAERIARFWLENATAAYGQAKHLVRSAALTPFADQLDAEAHAIGAALDTDEAHARIAAFAAASVRKPAPQETA
ncbi:enoyl-CoA hydratase/isomerase family protein [Microbacterium sp. P03]|uniref:enoyl-CoA hydratase/isomerase family protein n=1 Tax=Microbacterium sp. P03 TaxID=3366946 RepID=UPI003745C02B